MMDEGIQKMADELKDLVSLRKKQKYWCNGLQSGEMGHNWKEAFSNDFSATSINDGHAEIRDWLSSKGLNFQASIFLKEMEEVKIRIKRLSKDMKKEKRNAKRKLTNENKNIKSIELQHSDQPVQIEKDLNSATPTEMKRNTCPGKKKNTSYEIPKKKKRQDASSENSLCPESQGTGKALNLMAAEWSMPPGSYFSLPMPPPHHFLPSPDNLCKFFQRNGWCKFGEQCRFQHFSLPPPGWCPPPFMLPMESEQQARPLLILDLNHLLCDRVDRRHFLKGAQPDATIGNANIFVRPNLKDFLLFLLERFTLAVWTSATYRNAGDLVHFLFGEIERELSFFWTQEDCTRINIRGRHKPLFLKELSRVWDRYGWFNPSNTVLLDDSPEKCKRNPPHTAIHPASYFFSKETEALDIKKTMRKRGKKQRRQDVGKQNLEDPVQSGQKGHQPLKHLNVEEQNQVESQHLNIEKQNLDEPVQSGQKGPQSLKHLNVEKQNQEECQHLNVEKQNLDKPVQNGQKEKSDYVGSGDNKDPQTQHLSGMDTLLVKNPKAHHVATEGLTQADLDNDPKNDGGNCHNTSDIQNSNSSPVPSSSTTDVSNSLSNSCIDKSHDKVATIEEIPCYNKVLDQAIEFDSSEICHGTKAITLNGQDSNKTDDICPGGKLWSYLDELSKYKGDLRDFIQTFPYNDNKLSNGIKPCI